MILRDECRKIRTLRRTCPRLPRACGNRGTPVTPSGRGSLEEVYYPFSNGISFGGNL